MTRVAREVGTEGKLGGQAQVSGVGGTWKDLTDNVNFMASNLTDQVRGIVKVVTAVADGNLRQKLTVQAKGEVAALAETINNMTDTLATFAEQVTSVAREVGVEGRLGGQASVPGAAGSWRDLTDNVNLLAGNLTTQVRAIAEVATAVTKGDLTRSIQVETRGEVAELKDNINTMIANLRETTERNKEQDWLKTNVARFTSMLQGQRDLFTVAKTLARRPGAAGAGPARHHLPVVRRRLRAGPCCIAGRLRSQPGRPDRISLGEGLVGQCAVEKQRIILNDVPPDYTRVSSSLGDAVPSSIVVLPLLFEGEIKAVIELASLQAVHADEPDLPRTADDEHRRRAQHDRSDDAHRGSAQAVATVDRRVAVAAERAAADERRAGHQGQAACRAKRGSRTQEQRSRAGSPRAGRKSRRVGPDLEIQIRVPGQHVARVAHAAQLDFDPQPAACRECRGNLSPKQIDFARNVHSSGSDLLNLINDILDLSKIESGTVSVEVEEIPFAGLRDTIDRNFRHVAENKNLPFHVDFAADLPRTLISDSKRSQQILKNLLSNAVKFTSQGHVNVRVGFAKSGWSADHPVLSQAPQVVAFAVEDTGIGVAPEKQRLIFEAFQQADAGTSRKYGGTGLGLAISRELAMLLGGEIRLAQHAWPGKHLHALSAARTTPAPPRPITADGPWRHGHRFADGPCVRVLPVAREELIADDRERHSTTATRCCW